MSVCGGACQLDTTMSRRRGNEWGGGEGGYNMKVRLRVLHEY